MSDPGQAMSDADFYAPDDIYIEGFVPLPLQPVEGVVVSLALEEAATRGQPLPLLHSVRDGLALGLVEGAQVTQDGVRVWGRVDNFPAHFAQFPRGPLARAVSAIRDG